MAFKKNRVRVAGSGFTVFTFKNQPIGFAQQVGHQSAQPVAPATPIQPMDEPYPLQIITPAAAGMGTITLNLYELYYSKVWENIGVSDGSQFGSANRGTGKGFFEGANDIVDIFIRQASVDPALLNVVKFIRPPMLGGEGTLTTGAPAYWELYHNCVITNVTDGEDVNVGTMEVIKQITIGYTNVTRKGANTNLAYSLRDRATSLS